MTRFILMILLFLASPVLADDAEGAFDLGGDVYRAGQSVMIDGDPVADVFAAGETLRLSTEATGNVHMAGRYVTIAAPVGGSLYAMGQKVTLDAPVSGGLSAFGQTVTLRGTLAGNGRVFGQEVTIDAPVDGSLVVGGREVRITAPVAGDLVISTEELTLASGAIIEGTLTLYEETVGSLEVDESVAAKIERRPVEDFREDMREIEAVSPWAVARRLILGAVAVAVLAGTVAAMAPVTMASMRNAILTDPWRCFGTGFVAQSALIGAGLLVILTVIGALLLPAIWLLAALAWIAGYIVAAYALGVFVLMLAGRGEPDGTSDRVIAAGIGAVIVAVLGMIPVLGWIAMLILVLLGVGAIVRQIWPHGLFGAASVA
jgi:cytoskeletal protein CcmA (bactofilin family)